MWADTSFRNFSLQILQKTSTRITAVAANSDTSTTIRKNTRSKQHHEDTIVPSLVAALVSGGSNTQFPNRRRVVVGSVFVWK